MGRGHLVKLDRLDLHGDRIDRSGILRNLDAHLVRGGPMREAVIIAGILILALILWRPRKGGKG